MVVIDEVRYTLRRYVSFVQGSRRIVSIGVELCEIVASASSSSQDFVKSGVRGSGCASDQRANYYVDGSRTLLIPVIFLHRICLINAGINVSCVNFQRRLLSHSRLV